MIHANRIVTVGEQESIIDRPIILYRGDREVEIEFTLVGNEFMFSEEGNVIKSVNASHGQLVLNTPSGEHMFSELAECHEGKVVFIVTKEMIDEFVEVGFYSFQIRLYDSAEMKSRVTIPPVMNGFDIRNPIAAEDEVNIVDQGLVDYARVFKDQSNEELHTFDWTGAYNKTEWTHHDVITENKLNKIEDALYSINADTKELGVDILNTLDQVKTDADKYVKEHIADVETDIEEFERNLNTDVQKFKIDTNAAMTAHKNEFDKQSADILEEVQVMRDLLYVSCKSLKCIPNSEEAAVDNYSKITEALKSGVKLIVDDVYYIQGNATPEIINNDISLMGNNSNSCLIILSGQLFECNNNITIDNLRIEAPNKAIYFIRIVEPKKQSISITNSYFTGNIRILGTAIPDDFNYTTNPTCIQSVVIANNTFERIWYGGGNATVFLISDTPIDTTIIENNKVRNFGFVFYNNGITNGSANGTYVFENTKKVYIRNNIVRNDDDFCPTDLGLLPATYFCFSLLECMHCECIGNVFEGFHIFDTDVTCVYDNYFSVITLIYENNLWKNNVNFTPDLQYIDLMKSKMGSSDKLPSTRLYKNNTYVVEKEYADKFGKDRYLLKKEINTYQSPMDEVILKNNIIDVYILSDNRSKNIINYTCDGNTIKCYTSEIDTNTQSLVSSTQQMCDAGGAVVRYTNNTIIIQNPPLHRTDASAKSSAIITNYTGDGTNVNIVFSNNHIETYEHRGFIRDERSEEEMINKPLKFKITMVNNTFIVKSKAQMLYELLPQSTFDLTAFNNSMNVTLEHQNGYLYLFSNKHTGMLPVLNDFTIQLDGFTNQNQWIRTIRLDRSLNGTYHVFCKVKRHNDTAYEEFDFNCKVGNNGTYNTVTGNLLPVSQATDYSEQTYILDGTGRNYSNCYIHRDNFFTTKADGLAMTNINISNTTSNKEIMLHSIPPKYENEKITITIRIVKIS